MFQEVIKLGLAQAGGHAAACFGTQCVIADDLKGFHVGLGKSLTSVRGRNEVPQLDQLFTRGKAPGGDGLEAEDISALDRTVDYVSGVYLLPQARAHFL